MITKESTLAFLKRYGINSEEEFWIANENMEKPDLSFLMDPIGGSDEGKSYGGDDGGDDPLYADDSAGDGYADTDQ